MKITTNNVPRDPVAFCDLPEAVRPDFDYVDADDYSERFVLYRGSWYDLNEFQRITRHDSNHGWAYMVEGGSDLLAWDGIQTDTYFSGVVCRYVDGGERVVIGSVNA